MHVSFYSSTPSVAKADGHDDTRWVTIYQNGREQMVIYVPRNRPQEAIDAFVTAWNALLSSSKDHF